MDAKPASTALVPLVQTAEWSSSHEPPQPDSSFVTQLMAMGEQSPQAHSLRQATASDALSAYRTSQHRADAGPRARQII
ncbi:hypothetical protein [Bradyrhizobium sp. dw_78]|uniref:hypothetical protein n=1 Tax=Bradyrhizobium sp. dw_78 TaxID=2719793 RepID=UPI001BD64979|nr:hypothetical protein [Bradyrhizobium sp. dw_78]